MFKKWLPSFLAVGAAAFHAFSPAIQAYIAAHPRLLSFLGAAAFSIAHVLPSPIQKNDGGRK